MTDLDRFKEFWRTLGISVEPATYSEAGEQSFNLEDAGMRIRRDYASTEYAFDMNGSFLYVRSYS